MYWKIVWFLITKILWRADRKRGSNAKVIYGTHLYNWFSPYPEYIDKDPDARWKSEDSTWERFKKVLGWK